MHSVMADQPTNVGAWALDARELPPLRADMVGADTQPEHLAPRQVQ